MSAIAPARKITVVMSYPDGSNSLDVSDAFMGLSITSRAWDNSGIEEFSGTLQLSTKIRGLTLDPRGDRARFARGCRITITPTLVDNTTFHLPAWGELRITNPPTVGDVLSIQVGQKLSLTNFPQPPRDESGIELGNPVDPSEVISKYAEKLGLGALQDNITDYPFDAPIWQIDSTGVELIGAIALARGYVLYNDGESLKAQQINLSPATADEAIAVGEDELEYAETTTVEAPPEVVRVSGVGKKAKAIVPPQAEVSFSYASTYALLGVGSTEDRVLAETSISEVVGWGTTSPSIIRTTNKAKCRVFPTSQDTGLVWASTEIKTSFYGGDKRLDRTVSEVYVPRGSGLPDYYADSAVSMRLSREETTYTYSGEEVKSESVSVQQARAAVQTITSYDEDSDLLDLVPASDRTKTWRGQEEQGYFLTTTSQSYGVNAASSTSTSFSESGNNPPSAEYQPESVVEEEVLLSDTANFPSPAGSDTAEREVEVRLADGAIVDQAQCKLVAGIIGKMLYGEALGVSVEVPLSNHWITDYHPLKVVDVQQGAKTYRYIANPVSFELTLTRWSVGFGGILIGEVATPLQTTPATPIILPAQAIAGLMQFTGQINGEILPAQTFSGLMQFTGNINQG